MIKTPLASLLLLTATYSFAANTDTAPVTNAWQPAQTIGAAPVNIPQQDAPVQLQPTAGPAPGAPLPQAGPTPLPSAALSYAKDQVTPLPAESVEELHKAFDQLQRSESRAPVTAVPRISSLTVNLSPGSSLPLLRVLPNYPSTVTFTDETGAPWNIDAPPVNGNDAGFVVNYIPNSPVLSVQARRAYDTGSVTVYLKGLPVPVNIALSSGEPDKHTELLAGSPGSGKSLLANSMHLDAIANGNQDLPFMAFIDKGFTAQGFYDLIHDSLPQDQKDKIISIILRNDAEHCRNPFDIQLGLKNPISTEREYLLGMLTSLCIDPQTGIAPDAASCRQILSRAVDLVYRNNSEKDPVRYGATLSPDVDKALDESGCLSAYSPEWWEMATWYEVRDMLFDRNFIYEASLAQAQAVPELNDLQGALNSEDMREAFGSVNRPGSEESLLSYVSRCLTQALYDYPLISGRTRYTVSPKTRIRVVDVNNVTGKNTPEGKIRTGIMYQFARHLAGANDFYLPQYQDELYDKLDPRYVSLHRKRIEQLDQEVKLIFIDELHNIKGIPALWDALQTEDREQRKFGVRTVFASQYLDDYPPSILQSANSLYLMRVRSQDFDILQNTFNVPRTTLLKLLNTTKGPAPDGSGVTFLAVFLTTNGNVAQLLKNTVGPLRLWALNSTPSNRALRNMLYEALDGKTARRLLAESFPGGSAESHIRMMKKRAGNDDEGSAIRHLANELIAKAGYIQDNAA